MAITVTRCDGWHSTDVRYPPIWRRPTLPDVADSDMQIWLFCAPEQVLVEEVSVGRNGPLGSCARFHGGRIFETYGGSCVCPRGEGGCLRPGFLRRGRQLRAICSAPAAGYANTSQRNPPPGRLPPFRSRRRLQAPSGPVSHGSEARSAAGKPPSVLSDVLIFPERTVVLDLRQDSAAGAGPAGSGPLAAAKARDAS